MFFKLTEFESQLAAKMYAGKYPKIFGLDPRKLSVENLTHASFCRKIKTKEFLFDGKFVAAIQNGNILKIVGSNMGSRAKLYRFFCAKLGPEFNVGVSFSNAATIYIKSATVNPATRLREIVSGKVSNIGSNPIFEHAGVRFCLVKANKDALEVFLL